LSVLQGQIDLDLGLVDPLLELDPIVRCGPKTEAAVSLAFFSRLSSWPERSRVFPLPAASKRVCVAVSLSL